MKKLSICVLSLVLFSCPAFADVPVTGVTLSKQDISLTVGGMYYDLHSDYLDEYVMPENATNKKVLWSSSNEAAATVSEFGHVEGISPGSANITVTTEDGGFTAVCAVTVIVSDVQQTELQHFSNKREAAAKTPGFSEDDFEIVDGQVTVKKSIVENIAKKLLGTNDVEVFLLPWSEARIVLSGQSGKIAGVNYYGLDRPMLKINPEVEVWDVTDEALVLNVTSPETGEFLKAIAGEDDRSDGKFWIDAGSWADENYWYDLYALIKDGGERDLDKTENGSVVSQIAFVGKTEPQEDGGGCNAGYGSAVLLLSGLVFMMINRKK